MIERMSEKEIARWGGIRTRGKQRFIARETITFALIPLLATIVWYSLKSFWTGKPEFGSIDYGSRLFTSVVFALWGFFKARSHWMSQEDRYKTSAELVELTKADG